MVGWHHRLSGHEFEQTLGDGEGQGSLACCSPWGCKSWTWLSDWTMTKFLWATNDRNAIQTNWSKTRKVTGSWGPGRVNRIEASGIRRGPSKPTVGILGRPSWELMPRSRFSSLWSLVLSSHSVEISSYHGFYICPPIPISTEKKKNLGRSVFSQHLHSNASVLLGSPYPFIVITVAKGWDTNPPLWSGILIDDSSETCGPGDRDRDKASPSKI